MKAKEKAEELVEKYRVESWVISRDHDKQCALIAVNEILGYIGADRGTEFWLQVKSEIENL
jgi:hypothetical protein